MRASFLDHRVRREAKLLVKQARAAIGIKRGLQGKGGDDLEGVTAAMEQGLAHRDLAIVRRQLMVLEQLVYELVEPPPKSSARDYVESIGAAVLIALALRAFVVEAFKIPTSSMYPTLEIGDHIFVNKFIYGVRIPWTMTKLFELRRPKRGEVIVFIYPCDPDRDYIKRVVALAGDSVEVRCNVLYVNGVAVPSQLEDPDCSYRDRVESTGEWYTARCSTYAETVDGKVYRTFHDRERPNRDRRLADKTSEHPDGTLAAGDDHDFPLHDQATAPTCANAPPSEVASDYPPQVVGAIVQATPEAKAKVCEQRIHYVVPPGHIFAQGDNRNNSSDSRVWGSVPIENIKGKALFIWLSLDEHFELLKPWKLDGMRFRRIGNFVE